MADNFNLKQFLAENKLGAYSRLKENVEETLNEGTSPDTIETPEFGKEGATWKKTGKTRPFTAYEAVRGYIIDEYMADGKTINNKSLETHESNHTMTTVKEGFVFVESKGGEEMTMTSRSAYVTRPGNLYRATADVTSRSTFKPGDKVKYPRDRFSEVEDGWTVVSIEQSSRGDDMVNLKKGETTLKAMLRTLTFHNRELMYPKVDFDEYEQVKESLNKENKSFSDVNEATKDALDKMDNDVNQPSLESLVTGARGIIRSLQNAGFEDEDIYDFIVSKIKTLG